MTTTTTTTTTTSTGRSRWPLGLLALPAAVAIWSGWVGLGQMAGFGIVHPLPGIADGFTLNSAITLPIGVEAYSAYALGTWLSARQMPARARRFAAWSSLTALGLGLLGQVIYHLLSTAGYQQAPVWVVVFVACLPVLVLGAGAALHHLLGADADPTASDQPRATTDQQPGSSRAARPSGEASRTEHDAPAATRARKRAAPRRRLLGEYLAEARAQLAEGVEPTPVWCRRTTGCSAGTSVKLAAALRAELHDTTPPPAARLSSTTTASTSDREEHAA